MSQPAEQESHGQGLCATNSTHYIYANTPQCKSPVWNKEIIMIFVPLLKFYHPRWEFTEKLLGKDEANCEASALGLWASRFWTKKHWNQCKPGGEQLPCCALRSAPHPKGPSLPRGLLELNFSPRSKQRAALRLSRHSCTLGGQAACPLRLTHLA